MLKTMVFLDGSWFDTAVKEICRQKGLPRRILIEHVDLRSIQQAVAGHIRDALGFDVDLVRTYCVAGHPDPDTVGPDSKDNSVRIAAGWDTLGRLPCTVVELYPYSYGGREFPSADTKTDRQAVPGETKSDRAAVKEKCVDVALATKMLYFAAIPAAYDVAVLISGDRDYKPVLRAVRSLGKRTMLASFLELPSCAHDLKAKTAMGDLWDIPPLDLAPALKRNGDGQVAR